MQLVVVLYSTVAFHLWCCGPRLLGLLNTSFLVRWIACNAKCFGYALGICMDEGESPAEFRRKRNTAVRAYCERHHWWSRRWLQQALKWDSHLARDWQQQMKFYNEGVDVGTCQTNFSFAPLLRQWHDDDWILAHTTFRLRNDGRMDRETGLRRVRGSVSKRWQEGVEHASRLCQ